MCWESNPSMLTATPEALDTHRLRARQCFTIVLPCQILSSSTLSAQKLQLCVGRSQAAEVGACPCTCCIPEIEPSTTGKPRGVGGQRVGGKSNWVRVQNKDKATENLDRVRLAAMQVWGCI